MGSAFTFWCSSRKTFTQHFTFSVARVPFSSSFRFYQIPISWHSILILRICFSFQLFDQVLSSNFSMFENSLCEFFSYFGSIVRLDLTMRRFSRSQVLLFQFDSSHSILSLEAMMNWVKVNILKNSGDYTTIINFLMSRNSHFQHSVCFASVLDFPHYH